jgi:hypothetical protein
VVFVAVSAFLVAAVYSSSTFIAFGDYSCRTAPNGMDVICTTRGDNGKITNFSYCYKDDKGSWVCIQVPTQKTGGTNLPSGLKDALDNPIQESQTTSKAIVSPQDRFCKEGTGGSTGNKCLPCDPGLKFIVGCIDVTTGGPLDIPDTATSESGKSNDINPKDPGGFNNDENGPTINSGQ